MLKMFPIPTSLIPPAAVVVGVVTALLGLKLFILDMIYNPNPPFLPTYDFVIG